jgi:hypothetical protein
VSDLTQIAALFFIPGAASSAELSEGSPNA